jgi:hypothetical protein
MWQAADVEFDLIDGATDHPVLSDLIKTPLGTLELMAEPILSKRRLMLRGLHVQGVDLRPNALGPANLRRLAAIVMERLDCDEIVIEGAVRTTGAGKGRRPRPTRFARRPDPQNRA